MAGVAAKVAVSYYFYCKDPYDVNAWNPFLFMEIEICFSLFKFY